ncbi:hypothetical protein [Tsukamurella paurometabola]|uniref:hypothetical protein n=1 Tax=Tsukamurella paurometabola TaxID=2061 RepID=UPI00019F08A4|nr:hypothetical protein [Tsukamurella paurometabola]
MHRGLDVPAVPRGFVVREAVDNLGGNHPRVGGGRVDGDHPTRQRRGIGGLSEGAVDELARLLRSAEEGVRMVGPLGSHLPQ